jgi:hypothetical protein
MIKVFNRKLETGHLIVFMGNKNLRFWQINKELRNTPFILKVLCLIDNPLNLLNKKKCNCSCFEIDQEMDAILLIIGIVYGVCRIVIKSVQQCTHFLFSVNLLLVKGKYFTLNSLSSHFSPFENENYHRFIISLQANNLTSLSPYATDLTTDR